MLRSAAIHNQIGTSLSPCIYLFFQDSSSSESSSTSGATHLQPWYFLESMILFTHPKSQLCLARHYCFFHWRTRAHAIFYTNKIKCDPVPSSARPPGSP